MRSKLLPFSLTILALFTFSVGPIRSQTVVTFDDLYDNGFGTLITNAYQGLTWSNFGVVNSLLLSNSTSGHPFGYGYGMVSASNVAFNYAGNPAEIDALGTKFDLLSTYLTGAFNSNLNIEVQGFRGGTLLYDTTVVASATSPTLFTFDYMDIDRLYFNAFGGEPAFGGPSESNFAMDNMTIEFIPEPSSLLLLGLGLSALALSHRVALPYPRSRHRRRRF
jgi:hypothetical protein